MDEKEQEGSMKPLPYVWPDTVPSPVYSFNEDKLLAEIKFYIDKTYSGHYVGNYQAMDVIHDSGHGMGFALGNVIKYAKRYGKKDGYNRADLLKLIHYGILALNCHDDNNEKGSNEQR